jgi:hypothetical protein
MAARWIDRDLAAQTTDENRVYGLILWSSSYGRTENWRRWRLTRIALLLSEFGLFGLRRWAVRGLLSGRTGVCE